MVAYNFLPPTGQEAELARAASARLSRDTEADEPAKLFVFSSHDEQPIELPASAAAALARVVKTVAAGHGVTVLPLFAELRTSQAADILNVSRPYLIKLLDSGEIPHHKVGSHRRIRTEDVLNYKQTLRRQREAFLDRLVAESQELGLYD